MWQDGRREVTDTWTRDGLKPSWADRSGLNPPSSVTCSTPSPVPTHLQGCLSPKLPRAGPTLTEQAARPSSLTSHTVPLQRAGLGEVPVGDGEDAV